MKAEGKLSGVKRLAYPIINTPLVLCPIVGAICGDLGAGIVAGATLQLIFLGVMAIGGTLPADAALGSIVGTFLAIQTGQSVEVAVTFAVPVALIGSSLTFVGYFIRKVALMGPFAGIGDSIFQGTLRVITLGIGISLAATGNIFGAILHILLYNVLAHLVRYYGVTKSYEMGGQLMSNMSESGLMSKLTKAASIVGMMTVGAMAVTMTNFTIDKVWTIQGSEIVVQSVLDSIFPQLLPLLLTFGCYKAVKKGMSPALLMLILIVAGTLGKFLGLL